MATEEVAKADGWTVYREDGRLVAYPDDEPATRVFIDSETDSLRVEIDEEKCATRIPTAIVCFVLGRAR